MIVAVLDTNVLVSGIIGNARDESAPGGVLRAWRRGKFTLALSERIVAEELPRTLSKPYFRARIAQEDVDALIALFRRYSLVVTPTEGVTGIATHPEDGVILATARAAEASPLVTGDSGLLGLVQYEDIAILSPRAFLTILAESGDEEV